jgi:UDP-N-acetylmuramyl pentapeptide phosphotransferase/UDP-N-acetylglucosamine-1-phosphate transferase
VHGGAVVLVLLIVAACPVVGAFVATLLFLVWARRRKHLALPNERSSHVVPTPSSGGVGIVTGVLVGLGHWTLMGADADPHAAVIPSVLIAFTVGLVDDRRALRPRVKMALLLVAAVAAAIVGRVEVVRGVPFVGDLDLAWAAWPLTVFWLACYPNAFNFMDGLNGIASLTAIVSSAVFVDAAARQDDAVLFATALATLGFLPLNFPKARIFMGDAGSLPLGLLLAFCAVRANHTGALSFPASVLLLGPFLFDVVFTLIRRKREGKVIGEAHKEHLYQRLSRACGGSHAKSALVYAGLSAATGYLALTYDSRSEAGKLLSLIGPVAAMLAFAALVLAAERRKAATPER